MKECEKIKDLLSAYYDNCLGDKEKATVKAHLESCLNCREELEMYKHIENALILNENEMPSDEYFNEIRKNVRNTIESEFLPKKKISVIEYIFGNILKPVPAAFMLAIVIIIGMFLTDNIMFKQNQKEENSHVNIAVRHQTKKHSKAIVKKTENINFAKNIIAYNEEINESRMIKNEKLDAVENVEVSNSDNALVMTFSIDNGKIPVVWVEGNNVSSSKEDNGGDK